MNVAAEAFTTALRASIFRERDNDPKRVYCNDEETPVELLCRVSLTDLS